MDYIDLSEKLTKISVVFGSIYQFPRVCIFVEPKPSKLLDVFEVLMDFDEIFLIEVFDWLEKSFG